MSCSRGQQLRYEPIESQVGSTRRLFFRKLFGRDSEHFIDWELDESQIIELVKVLTGNAVRLGVVPAMYTYLGQMITHEIIPKTNGKNSRSVSPFLSLDSLYPSLFTLKGFKMIDRQGKFQLESINGIPDRDIPREKSGLGIHMEYRNDENVILIQLEVFWKRVHNKIIDLMITSNPKLKTSRWLCFNSAKSCTVLFFQQVIIEDFLKRVLNNSVWQYYFGKGAASPNRNFLEPINCLNRYCYQTPTEFSQAAFRFGHSMVLEEYLISHKRRITLDNIFRSRERLDKDNLIDWKVFLSRNFASPLGVSTADALQSVPEKNGAQIEYKDVVYLDLLASTRVPTAGPIVERLINDHKLYFQQFLSNGNISKYLGEISFSNNYLKTLKITLPNKNVKVVKMDWKEAPLWVFLLKEAEGTSSTSTTADAGRLGPLGSIVVAETIVNAIEGSVINCYSSPKEKLKILKHAAPIYKDVISRDDRFGLDTLVKFDQ